MMLDVDVKHDEVPKLEVDYIKMLPYSQKLSQKDFNIAVLSLLPLTGVRLFVHASHP